MEVNSANEIYLATNEGVQLWGHVQLVTMLEELIEARRYNDFQNEETVNRILDVIAMVLTMKFRHPFGRSFVRNHFDLLKQRFKLFKYVVEFPTVDWNPQTNVVVISRQLKRAMLQDNPLTQKYFTQGEPWWDNLQFLFDKPDIYMSDERLILPTADDGLFEIPRKYSITNEPLFARVREREYMKIYNDRWSVAEYI